METRLEKYLNKYKDLIQSRGTEEDKQKMKNLLTQTFYKNKTRKFNEWLNSSFSVEALNNMDDELLETYKQVFDVMFEEGDA